jgi:hypothetical protein
MSDVRNPAGERVGPVEPHPVDAVLAALRAVPDSVLRGLEPATIYLPEPTPVSGGADAAAGKGTRRRPR